MSLGEEVWAAPVIGQSELWQALRQPDDARGMRNTGANSSLLVPEAQACTAQPAWSSRPRRRMAEMRCLKLSDRSLSSAKWAEISRDPPTFW